jgi:hypothetical protein
MMTKSGVMRVILIIGGVVVALGALALFFGAGSQLTRQREVSVVARVDEIPPEVASQIRVGDPIFTDIAGAEVGRVTAVVARPEPVVADDAMGRAHLGGDPTNSQVDVTVTGEGRVGTGLVIIHSQAVLPGHSFGLVSSRYDLIGTVVSVRVR